MCAMKFVYRFNTIEPASTVPTGPVGLHGHWFPLRFATLLRARPHSAQGQPALVLTSASLSQVCVVSFCLLHSVVSIPVAVLLFPLITPHLALAFQEEKGGPYKASLPLSHVSNPVNEVLLAYKMNGEELTPDHGFPLRIIAPGE